MFFSLIYPFSSSFSLSGRQLGIDYKLFQRAVKSKTTNQRLHHTYTGKLSVTFLPQLCAQIFDFLAVKRTARIYGPLYKPSLCIYIFDLRETVACTRFSNLIVQFNKR